MLHESCLIKSTEAELQIWSTDQFVHNFWLHAEELCPLPSSWVN